MSTEYNDGNGTPEIGGAFKDERNFYMKTKAIVFTRRGHAEWMDVDASELRENDVLVRLEVSTISSGTERANLLDDGLLSVHKGAVAGANAYPKRLGYSCSGIVTAVGSAVTRVKVGDRVACWWTTHSEYNCIPENKVLKLADNVSFAEAALWHIATFPLAAIRKTKLELGESAIVMGMGILGLMAVKLLSAAGAAPIIAVDPVAEKRELALAQGADYVFDPFAEDFEETCHEDVYQIMIGFREPQQHIYLQGTQDLQAAIAWHRAVDIVSSKGGKSNGIRAVLDYFGLDASQAMAFGDSYNDMEMFQLVGTGIAMGNGAQALKDIATDVCGDVSEDGIYRYCLEKGLI